MAEERAATTAVEPALLTTPRPPNAAERAREASLGRRQARYEEAARLHGQGVSTRRIAALLRADRETVRGWLRSGGAPSWQKPKRGSSLDPHVPLLKRRWAEGCHNCRRWQPDQAANAAQERRSYIPRGGTRPLERALAELSPEVSVQKCKLHRYRNLSAHASDALDPEITAN